MSFRSNKKGIACIGFTENILNYAFESPVQFMKDRRGLFGLSHYLAQHEVKLTIAKCFLGYVCRWYEISCEEVLNVFNYKEEWFLHYFLLRQFIYEGLYHSLGKINYQALIGYFVNWCYPLFILVKYFVKFMHLVVWVTYKASKGKFSIQVMIFC